MDGDLSGAGLSVTTGSRTGADVVVIGALVVVVVVVVDGSSFLGPGASFVP